MWFSSDRTNSVRRYAAATQLEDGKLLVTGGNNGYVLNIAEMLTEEGWESNIPSLPVTVYAHCMVTLNSTTVMSIGGVHNGTFSKKTFYFTFGEQSWIEGPELIVERIYQSCGKIKRDMNSQEMSIIVAGGLNTDILSSVEILVEGSNEWQYFNELPYKIRYSQMIENPNGGVVLIGGYSPSIVSLDTLYQLPHVGQGVGWTKMEQTMKTSRYQHTAFLVPDNTVECS